MLSAKGQSDWAADFALFGEHRTVSLRSNPIFPAMLYGGDATCFSLKKQYEFVVGMVAL